MDGRGGYSPASDMAFLCLPLFDVFSLPPPFPSSCYYFSHSPCAYGTPLYLLSIFFFPRSCPSLPCLLPLAPRPRFFSSLLFHIFVCVCVLVCVCVACARHSCAVGSRLCCSEALRPPPPSLWSLPSLSSARPSHVFALSLSHCQHSPSDIYAERDIYMYIWRGGERASFRA